MAEDKKTASENNNTMADVSRPGKSAPSPTSKPVLISNRAIIKDPMVVEVTNDDGEEGSSAPSGAPPLKKDKDTGLKVRVGPPSSANNPSPTRETVIEPLAEAETSDKAEDKPVSENKAVAAVKPEASEENEETAKTDTTPPATEPEKSVAPEAENDEDSDKEDSKETDNPDLLEAEAAKQAEHEAAISKLVEGKQYFLPINSVEKRRSRRFVILGILLSVLLIAAWADLALDAGLITITGLKAPTHLFSSVSSPAATTPILTTPVATPTTAFTSSIDGINFKYPTNWVVTKTLTSKSESLSFVPPVTKAASALAGALYSVSYGRNLPAATSSTAASSTTYTVVSVGYTKLPSTAAKAPLYDQHFIVKAAHSGSADVYLSFFNLTLTKGALHVNQVISDPGVLIQQPFSVNATTDQLTLGGEAAAAGAKGGTAGSSSLSDAQSFDQDSLYSDANNILLSFRAPVK